MEHKRSDASERRNTNADVLSKNSSTEKAQINNVEQKEYNEKAADKNSKTNMKRKAMARSATRKTKKQLKA